jgi:ketosteroid isomerase-like protein
MPDLESAEEAILAEEHRALERWSQGDPLGYSHAAAPDITYFDDIGAQLRVEGIEALREYLTSLQGKIPVHSYAVVDPKVQVLGDVGILTFRYHPASPDGGALPPWKATTVYRRVDGRWQMVHGHWSMVKSA